MTPPPMTPQEEPVPQVEQLTPKEMALIHQMRRLEQRRAEYIMRPGGQEPLSLLNYDGRKYLEMRQGFQPILIPEHLISTVRAFLAQNLPQHLRAIRAQAQSPPNSPPNTSSMQMGSMSSGEDMPVSPMSSLPASAYGDPISYPESSFDQPVARFSSPDHMAPNLNGLSLGSPAHAVPNMSLSDSWSNTTLQSQNMAGATNLPASLLPTSMPALALPGQAVSSMGTTSMATNNMSLSLSSQYNVMDYANVPTPTAMPLDGRHSPPLSKQTNKHSRKISGSKQRKLSRSVVRKQDSLPYSGRGQNAKMDVDDNATEALSGDAYNMAHSSPKEDASDNASYCSNEDNANDDEVVMGTKSDSDSSEHPLRKPANAFILYRQAKNRELRSKDPGLSVEKASNHIGRLWKEETEDEKNRYRKMADKARDEYFAKKKRLQVREKQRKLEREDQSGRGHKSKRQCSESRVSPPQSLIVSASRDLSSFSPESLARQPMTAVAQTKSTGVASGAPLVRMTRSLTDGFDRSVNGSSILASPYQQMGSGGEGYFGETGAAQGLEQHVASSVELLKESFNETFQRPSPVQASMTQPVSIPGSGAVDSSASTWMTDSPAMASMSASETQNWEGMLQSWLPKNS